MVLFTILAIIYIVELAIWDEGIGIKESLLDNPVYNTVSTDLDPIRLALRLGISKAFAPGNNNVSQGIWANSGYGLYMVSELCKELGGSFIILSGRSAVKIAHENKNEIYSTEFDGTAIQIRIRTSRIDNYEEVARRILKRGEEKVRERRDGFTSASRSTKSLFWDGN